MASSHVTDNAERTNLHPQISPRNLRRSWSSGSPTDAHGNGNQKCVCAPATHSGSFKCRLHRTNSQGHSPRSDQIQQQQQQQQSKNSNSNSPSHTVEAQ